MTMPVVPEVEASTSSAHTAGPRLNIGFALIVVGLQRGIRHLPDAQPLRVVVNDGSAS